MESWSPTGWQSCLNSKYAFSHVLCVEMRHMICMELHAPKETPPMAHFLEFIIYLLCWNFIFIGTSKSQYLNVYGFLLSDNDNVPWFYITIQKKMLYFLVPLIQLILFCAYFWLTPRNVFGFDYTLIHYNKFDSLKIF